MKANLLKSYHALSRFILHHLSLYFQLQEETYPVLLKNARFWLAYFGSTNLCEQGFFVMKLNKSKL